jgi:putative GTP pyrophosphokinase
LGETASDRPEILLPASPASTSIDDLLLNALYVHNKGQFKQAVEFYTTIIALSPPALTASIIYKHRGMAFFAMSRYEDAVRDFSKSLELDPKSYKAAYYRAVVHQVEKDYTKAADDFSFALSINPYQAWALYRRAQVYFHIGDYPAALADCENAISISPDFEAAAKFKQVLLQKLKM